MKKTTKTCRGLSSAAAHWRTPLKQQRLGVSWDVLEPRSLWTCVDKRGPLWRTPLWRRAIWMTRWWAMDNRWRTTRLGFPLAACSASRRWVAPRLLLVSWSRTVSRRIESSRYCGFSISGWARISERTRLWSSPFVKVFKSSFIYFELLLLSFDNSLISACV